MTYQLLTEAALSYAQLRQKILSEWQPPCGCGLQVGQFVKCSDCPSAKEYRQKLKASLLQEGQP
jgi:hypothetical protein